MRDPSASPPEAAGRAGAGGQPEAAQDASPAERQRALFAFLDAHAIAHHTVRHPPVFTVTDGEAIKAGLPGGHTKNLFLKDRAGQLWLICAIAETEIRLNHTHRVIGAERLSFGRPDAMREALGVAPGSVTLFALVNDKARAVRLALDQALFAHEKVNFHPLSNDATTTISRDGMIAFLRGLGRNPLVVNFQALLAGAPIAASPLDAYLSHN
jgi:Ala-tRNA(Pro) deacylase